MATDALSAPIDGAQVKTCTACGQEKSLEAFSKHPMGKMGRQSICRPCQAVKDAARHARNRAAKIESALADGRTDVVGVEFPCAQCNTPTIRKSYMHKYCDACAVAKETDYVTKYATKGKAEYLRLKALKPPKPKRVPKYIPKVKVGDEFVCSHCEKPSIRTGGAQKYCSECKFEAKKLQNKIAARARRKTPEGIAAQKARDVRPRTDMDRAYIREWMQRRAASDPQYVVNRRMKAMIGNALRGKKAGRSWQSLVGYTCDELMRHIERQFLDGMSWENRRDWHIDHILPVTSFEFDSAEHPDFRACWALTNLRPMWASENIKKGNKVLFLV